jgi:amino acid permease
MNQEEQNLKNIIKKDWYKSKTIIINSIVTIIGVIYGTITQLMPQLANNLDMIKGFNKKYWVLAIILIGLFNAINRKFTTMPVKFKKELEIKDKDVNIYNTGDN